MNMEYVRGLRDYFAKLKPEQIDQREGYSLVASDPKPCGCVGLHSAIFNNSWILVYLEGRSMKALTFELGERDNENNGLTDEILQEAYKNIGGRNEHFEPYGPESWGVPVVDVLDEVIRMHSE